MIADIIAKFACVSVNSSSSREVTGNLWKDKSNIVVKRTQRWNDKSNHDSSGGVADEGGNDFYRNGEVDDDDRDDDDYEGDDVACTTDETKLWFSPSVKQCQNPCPGPPPVYKDLSTRHH